MMFYNEDLNQKITSYGKSIINEYFMFIRKEERKQKIIKIWSNKIDYN